MRGHRERGATLIELVISIVVIAIAASAVLGVLSSTVGRSADAMVLSQGVAIAEAYLEEISLKPYDDPDGRRRRGAALRLRRCRRLQRPRRQRRARSIRYGLGAACAVHGDRHRRRRARRSRRVPDTAAERIDVRVTYPGNGTVALTGYKTRL